MKKTTPTNSPLHRGRDEREKALQYNNGACPPYFWLLMLSKWIWLQYNNGACPPPFQGGARGGSIINLKSKIKTWFTLISY